MKKQIKKLLGAKRLILGKRRPAMPLFIIAILIVGVAGSLIYHYTVDIDTTGGEVLGDPYWTTFTDMLGTEVDTVPLPNVVQNSYAETDHYNLSLVNPLTRVAMVYTVTGTINTGVTVDCYIEDGAVDILWQEGDDYAIPMGNIEYPAFVELYWKISASYEATVGPLGDFGFRFVAAENPIIPFALSVDPITQGPGAELQDVATDTMQTTIDFGTITPDDPAVINEDYQLYGVGHILVQYAWTGLPADVHIAVDWFDGSTWNTWATDVDYDLAYAEELLLRFSITADPGSDHSAGLAVGLVLTEGVAPVDPFAMSADITESGQSTDMDIVDSGDLVTVLTVMDFGMITQGVPTVYTGAAIKCTSNSIIPSYTWTVLPSDVTVVVEYSTNGGSTWVVWDVGVDTPLMTAGTTMLLRLTITADALAEYPAGLTGTINFHAG